MLHVMRWGYLLFHAARDDDGWLDVLVFRKPGPFQALYYLWKVFLGTHLGDSSVCHRRARHVVVSSQDFIPVQIDGDPGGILTPATKADVEAGWTITVIPAAVEIVAPGQHSECPSSARQRWRRAIKLTVFSRSDRAIEFHRD